VLQGDEHKSFIGCDEVRGAYTASALCDGALFSLVCGRPFTERIIAQPLTLVFGMEMTSEFARRNVYFDDWEVPLQRICDNQKRLFDEVGPFDVRLIRFGELHFHNQHSL
jgi:hypothetical protein